MLQIIEETSTAQVVAIVGAISGLVSAAFGAGGAWMASKKALNGTREAVGQIEKNVGDLRTEVKAEMAEIRADVRSLVASNAEQNEAIARLEVGHEAHAGWIRRLEGDLAEERRRHL